MLTKQKLMQFEMDGESYTVTGKISPKISKDKDKETFGDKKVTFLDEQLDLKESGIVITCDSNPKKTLDPDFFVQAVWQYLNEARENEDKEIKFTYVCDALEDLYSKSRTSIDIANDQKLQEFTGLDEDDIGLEKYILSRSLHYCELTLMTEDFFLYMNPHELPVMVDTYSNQVLPDDMEAKKFTEFVTSDKPVLYMGEDEALKQMLTGIIWEALLPQEHPQITNPDLKPLQERLDVLCEEREKEAREIEEDDYER